VESSPGVGWWRASDGNWYAPEQHPDYQPPAPEPPTLATAPVLSDTSSYPVVAPPAPIAATPDPAFGRPVSVTTHVTVQHDARSGGSSVPEIVLNLIWLVFGGFWLALAYVFAGILNMITIIGIPFGIQAFKLAGYALWPFGRVVVERTGRDVGLSTLGNVVWFIFGGFWLAMIHLVTGLFLCLTIIGIPLGIADIKMAGLAIAPFGRRIVSKRDLATMTNVIVVSTVDR
jgi:uncharacterized membrane protein YccF (DUF307 family)